MRIHIIRGDKKKIGRRSGNAFDITSVQKASKEGKEKTAGKKIVITLVCVLPKTFIFLIYRFLFSSFLVFFCSQYSAF